MTPADEASSGGAGSPSTASSPRWPLAPVAAGLLRSWLRSKALRPTNGAIAATTNCGAKMQIDRIKVAVSGARMVRSPAIIGKAAALANWNSSTAPTKISSARFCSKERNADGVRGSQPN